MVDDDPDTAEMLRRALGRHGFQVDAVSAPEDALARAEGTVYAAAVLDLVMPGQDGAALAETLRRRQPGLPVALLTGYVHSPLLANAERSGIGVFTKPVAIQDVVDFLREELAGG